MCNWEWLLAINKIIVKQIIYELVVKSKSKIIHINIQITIKEIIYIKYIKWINYIYKN